MAAMIITMRFTAIMSQNNWSGNFNTSFRVLIHMEIARTSSAVVVQDEDKEQ